MLPPGQPKFRRRKAERPNEILDAALAVFAERGFAGARLDEIAARAGVSKGALYLYFETKEDLFRAVVGQVIAPNLQMVRTMIRAHPGPIDELMRLFAGRMAQVADSLPVGAVAKMVVGEARNFPELARVWHDELISQMLGALCDAITAAQGRGEVRAGDPRLFAVQLAAPMVMALLWRETFEPVGAQPIELPALIAQHIDTLLHGLLLKESDA